jgi:hypothetical protein
MGIYRDETFILAAVGTRTVSQYSDAACTVQISSDTNDLNVTNDGDKTSVNWVDDNGFTTAPPAGLGATVNATKSTISGTESAGPFSFKTLLFVNDLISPMQILFGDEESMNAVFDAEGYPDNIRTTGNHAQ